MESYNLKHFGSPTVSANFSGPNPNIIRYFGDPISAMDMNSTTVIPSMSFRWKNSAHSYKGLFIKDAVPIHDTMKNPLSMSGNDEDSEVITE